MSKNPVRRVPFVGGPLNGQEMEVELRPVLVATIEPPRMEARNDDDAEKQIISVSFNEVLYVLHQMSDGTYRYVVRGQVTP